MPSKLTLKKELKSPEIFFAVARSKDSSRWFVGASDFKVSEVDFALTADSNQPKDGDKPKLKPFAAGHESYVTCLGLAGDQLISGGYDRGLIWWDTKEQKQIRTVDAHDKWIRNLAVSPDGKLVASVADDMQCKIWDTESGKLVRTLSNHKPITPQHFPSMLYAVAISADGKLIATGDKVGLVVVSELESGKRIAELETPIMYTWDPGARVHSIGGIRSLAFSPDGKQLAVGGMGKVGNIDHLEGPARIEVFQWQDNKRTHEFSIKEAKGLVEHLQFGPDGDWLIAAGGDSAGFVRVLNLKDSKTLIEQKIDKHVHRLSVNDAGTEIVVAAHGQVSLWELG